VPSSKIDAVIAEYVPNPIRADDISLPAELVELTERLAENAHDLWAAERVRQGWSWGPKRDDALKKHPCLIPYADLSESEKEFDRQTAMGTLKAILKLGYSIKSLKK
jgi:ryanodine receptor 2